MSEYRFRPSKMALTVACTGSVQMQERYPDESGPEAAQGTVAHECLAQLLRYGTMPALGSVITQDGHAITVDEDMHYGAQMAYNVILAWNTPVTIEQGLPCHSIHRECGGTPDVRGYVVGDGLIRLLDYKYGFGIVDPFENWQLLSYLSGYLDELGIHDLSVGVEFTIVQPRASHRDGPIRTWSFLASDVRAQFNIMRTKCEEASSDKAMCTPGAHCYQQRCSAAQGCDALHRSTYNTLAYIRKPEAFDLDPQAAAREFRLLKEAESIIRARKEGLEVRVMSDVEKGIVNPYYVVGNINKHRAWKPGMENAAIGIGALYGKNLCQPRRAMSPSQAEKEMGAVDAALIKDCWYKPVGERKLVEFDNAATRKIFGGS